jgi:FkbM family methyltransferase
MLIPFKDLFKRHDIRPTGVVHIGAHEGQEAVDYYAHGAKRTVWIEALPSTFAKLKRNMEVFPNACVSDTDGNEVEFNVASNEGQSSSFLEFGTHAEMHPTVKFTGKVHLQTSRFDTLAKDYGLARGGYDFLNVDLQGAELLALKGMGYWLEQFQWAYLEVNREELYRGCALIGEVDGFMALNGFAREETKWTNWGWGDALYVRI